MYWVKIKKDDYTMTEGVWTLSNAHLKTIGSFKVDTYAQRSVRGVIRNGYLYLTAYDDTGCYKINVNNPADVTLIAFGFKSEGKSQTGSGTCANYLFMVNDLIIGWDYQIKPDDTVVQTVGSTRLEGRSNRKYRDELLVAEAAREHGYTDIYRQTLIPMTEMQKLMGKSAFEEILGDLIYKPPGKPTLVPNTDKRPAMNVTNAENEFDKIMED